MRLEGDTGLIPGLGRSPGEGNDNPFQNSCLENSLDRRSWQPTAFRLQTTLCSHRASDTIKWLNNNKGTSLCICKSGFQHKVSGSMAGPIMGISSFLFPCRFSRLVFCNSTIFLIRTSCWDNSCKSLLLCLVKAVNCSLEHPVNARCLLWFIIKADYKLLALTRNIKAKLTADSESCLPLEKVQGSASPKDLVISI